jgi:hypothetical protein
VAYVGGESIPGNAGIQSVTFGEIDTFSLIQSKVPLELIFAFARNSTIPIPTITDVVPKSFDLDVYEIRSLVANFAADISHLTLDIQLHLPFVRFETMLNNGRLMHIQINRLELQGNRITGSSVVWFPNEPENLDRLVNLAADILFHRSTMVSDTLSIQGFSFGSQQSPIESFKTLTTTFEIRKYYEAIAKYFDEKKPLELEDIQAVCVQKGINVDIKTTPPPFPVTIKLQYLELDIGWQLEGKGVVYRAMQVRMDQIALPSFKVFANVNLDETDGALKPLRELVIQMLTFEQFTSNARLGYLVMVGSNGQRFVPFDSSLFSAPGLYIPVPMYVKLDPYQLPLIAFASVRNPTPVHVDLGSAFLKVNGMDGMLALDATSRGNVVAPNNKEGADPPEGIVPPTFAILDVNIESLPTALNGNREPLDRLARNMIENPSAFEVLVEIRRDGSIIDWVDTVTKYLLASGLADVLMPLFGELIENIDIEILPPPDFRNVSATSFKQLKFSKNVVLVQ